MDCQGQSADKQREGSGSWPSATLHVHAKDLIPSAPAPSSTQPEACLPMVALGAGEAGCGLCSAE